MTRIVTQRDAERDHRLLREFAASGTSVACANTFLNPVEVVKTRMQLTGASAAAGSVSAATTAAAASHTQAAAAAATTTARAAAAAAHAPLSATRSMSHATTAVSSRAMLLDVIPGAAGSSGSSSSSSSVFQGGAVLGAARRQGFVATAGLIYRQEGLSGFTRGWQASAARAVFNGGIRLGLYDPIKQLLSRDGSGRDLHVGQKLAAGSISGCIGAVLTTPMELVKTRLQAPSATTRSVKDVLRSVIGQYGVAGLWRGATPSVMRLILLNSSMVATYDEVKGHINRHTQWGPGIKLTLASSMVAGIVTTTVINPADVIRAYMQTGRGSSVIQVAQNILAKEGFAGFSKGWTAAYARTGPQTLIIFTVSEIVRPLFGLNVIGNCG